MKRIGLYFLAACFTACCFSAQAKHMVKVIGLVNLADWKVALLEMSDSPPNDLFLAIDHVFLKEGASYDDEQIKGAHVHIEILKIDFTNGIVKAKEDGKDAVYEYKRSVKTGEIPPQTTVRLENVGMDGILDFYNQIKHRSLLIHPDIYQQTNFPVLLQVQDKAEAVGALEKALRKNGVAPIPDGENFEMIVPVRLEKAIRSNLENMPPQKPDTEIPGWGLDCSRAELGQVLKLYESLVGKKMIQNEPPPNMSFSIRTHSQLTKTAMLHAFDTLLAWQGIKAINVDEKSFKFVRIAKP
jgi:hypothetical protein